MAVIDGKTRIQVTLTDYQAGELEGICKRTGASKSTVMAIALDAFLRHKRLANEVIRLNEELEVKSDALDGVIDGLISRDDDFYVSTLTGEDTDSLLSLVEHKARECFDSYLEGGDDELADLAMMNCCAMIALGHKLCNGDQSRYADWFSADAGEEGWTEEQANQYESWVSMGGDYALIRRKTAKRAK